MQQLPCADLDRKKLLFAQDWHWVILINPDTPNPSDPDHSGLCVDASLTPRGQPLVAASCILQHRTTASVNPQRWTWHPEARNATMYRRMAVSFVSSGGHAEQGCLRTKGESLVLGDCDGADEWYAAGDGETLITNPELPAPPRCIVMAGER